MFQIVVELKIRLSLELFLENNMRDLRELYKKKETEEALKTKRKL